MEIKLIALSLFIIILVYLNYRRYRRLQQQRALLQTVRNGLALGQVETSPGGRRSVITLPRHQIAIIFPPRSPTGTGTQTDATSINMYNDLPPSYQDLFKDEAAIKHSREVPSTPTSSINPSSVETIEACPPYQPPPYAQIISNNNNGNAQSAARPTENPSNRGLIPAAPEPSQRQEHQRY